MSRYLVSQTAQNFQGLSIHNNQRVMSTFQSWLKTSGWVTCCRVLAEGIGIMCAWNSEWNLWIMSKNVKGKQVEGV